MDIKKHIARIVCKAITSIYGEQLKTTDISEIVEVEVPNNKEYGDYATNVAMKLAKILHQPPIKIANDIANRIKETPELSEHFARIDVAPPGFINMTSSQKVLAEIMKMIVREDTNYGRGIIGEGKKAIVEFVSANPTGPLHIGHARNAVVGDSIARLLEAVGYDVSREYYFNDAGVQMKKLGESLRTRYLQQLGEDVPFPEDGYKGDYMVEIAKDFVKQYSSSQKDNENTQIFTDFAVKDILKTIEDDLRDLRIQFDNWFTETSLHKSGKVTETLEKLKSLGKLYEQDGAWWLRSSEKGDEKDRVVIKSDGEKTYLAPDIAYHDDKFGRGFDMIVNLFGADHHSYIDRLKAAVEFLGYDSSKLKCIIYQMVTLLRNGERTKLSTRSGEFITIREMIQEIGTDVIRFFLNMRSADSQMVFDWELAKDTSMNNPVFYVQYAHARFCSLFNKAKEMGIEWEGIDKSDISLLSTAEEKDMIKKMADLPTLVEESAAHLEPHHLTLYARELAGLFHQFFTIGTKDPDYRIIIPDNMLLTQARLSLIYCLRIVIRNTLTILGITAPERM